MGFAGKWKMKTVEHIAEQIIPGLEMQMNFAQRQQRGLLHIVVSISVVAFCCSWSS